MVVVTDAVFDGRVLHPVEEIVLPPNSKVRLTIETADDVECAPQSFFDTALRQHLKGPPDWATNFEQYLYGDLSNDAD